MQTEENSKTNKPGVVGDGLTNNISISIHSHPIIPLVLAVKNRGPLAIDARLERFTVNFDSFAQYAVFCWRLE